MFEPLSFSSEEAVAKLKNRDPILVKQLIQAYTKDLMRAAKGLGFDDLASEDLVQNVWLTFFDIANTFEGRSQIKTFLFGILYNKASELRRENSKFLKHDSIDDTMESKFDQKGNWLKPPIDPESFYLSSQMMSLIQKCLDALPTTQRMAFCLKEIEGHQSTEICNILKLTVTNLGVILYRAKARLRECIESKTKFN